MNNMIKNIILPVMITVLFLGSTPLWWESAVCFIKNCEQELINDCKANKEKEIDYCKAYDKNALLELDVRPNDSCKLSLTATKGYFFINKEVTVVSENYIRVGGEKAKIAVKPVIYENIPKYSNSKFITKFEGSIGCTNYKGSGRTCESSAKIEAVSYPIRCLSVRNKLKK